jgi:hypothetical protein
MKKILISKAKYKIQVAKIYFIDSLVIMYENRNNLFKMHILIKTFNNALC